MRFVDSDTATRLRAPVRHQGAWIADPVGLVTVNRKPPSDIVR